MAQGLNSGLGCLIIEVPRSHTVRRTSSEGVVRFSQKPLLTQHVTNTREIGHPSNQATSELYHLHRHVCVYLVLVYNVRNLCYSNTSFGVCELMSSILAVYQHVEKFEELCSYIGISVNL